MSTAPHDCRAIHDHRDALRGMDGTGHCSATSAIESGAEVLRVAVRENRAGRKREPIDGRTGQPIMLLVADHQRPQGLTTLYVRF
jgi:hypothetical protein